MTEHDDRQAEAHSFDGQGTQGGQRAAHDQVDQNRVEQNRVDQNRVDQSRVDQSRVDGSRERGSGEQAFERTGDDRIDEVLDSVAELDERPLEEHVAVFEAAHETLRAALSDAGREPGAPAPCSRPFPGPRPR